MKNNQPIQERILIDYIKTAIGYKYFRYLDAFRCLIVFKDRCCVHCLRADPIPDSSQVSIMHLFVLKRLLGDPILRFLIRELSIKRLD